MGINIGTILSFLAAFQLFFVALFLFFHQKGIPANNRLIGLILLLLSISLGDFTLRESGIQIQFQVLHLVDDGFFFLYGPLLYFYVKRIVYKDFKFKFINLIHLVPFVLYIGYLTNIALSLTLEDQNKAMDQVLSAKLPTWMYVSSLLIYVYNFVYLLYCQKTLTIYRSIIKDKFSSIEGINLNWLGFIIRSFTVIMIIALIHNVIPVLDNVYFQYSSAVVLLVFTFFFSNQILVKALNQPAIFSGISSGETEKYSGSNLSSEQISDYSKKLTVLLKQDKLYLNENLTLTELASHLHISPKELSQVINQGFGQKFYDFINTFRCEEVKKILQESDTRVTILEAMYQAGFNSKSSFNKEFKKLTGLTPSEYKKSLNS